MPCVEVQQALYLREGKHLRELFDIEGDSVMLELQKPHVVDSRDKASIRQVTL